MHLSPVSDCFASDRGPADRQHLDVLLRGLVLVGVAALLVGLTLLADFAPTAAADPSPGAATRSSGTAVNLMHREVIRN